MFKHIHSILNSMHLKSICIHIFEIRIVYYIIMCAVRMSMDNLKAPFVIFMTYLSKEGKMEHRKR